MSLFRNLLPSLVAPPPHAEVTPGILASRLRAQPALLRMLSRARRQQTPLVLLRIEPTLAVGRGGDERQGQNFWASLGTEIRIGDLLWWEPGAVVMALLETGNGTAVLDRLQPSALAAGARPRWQRAHFPEQGLTIEALLQSVTGSAVAARGPGEPSWQR